MRLAVGASFLLFASLTVSRASAQIAKEEIIFQSETWVVRRTVDQMTDKPECMGFLNSDLRFELSKGEFNVDMRGRGGIRAITIRYGEESVLPQRPPTETEQGISIVNFRGRAFDHLMRVDRVRIRVLTMLGPSLVEEDLDLRGIETVHQFLATDPRCHS
jgi:hypothetical protein